MVICHFCLVQLFCDQFDTLQHSNIRHCIFTYMSYIGLHTTFDMQLLSALPHFWFIYEEIKIGPSTQIPD